MKAALVGTLVPTPGTIATMYKLIASKAREVDYSQIDYMRVDDGMVLYLNKSAGSSEAVVLDQLDTAKPYAQILMEEGSSGPEKWLWRQVPELGYRPAEERLIFAFLTESFGRQEFDETN